MFLSTRCGASGHNATCVAKPAANDDEQVRQSAIRVPRGTRTGPISNLYSPKSHGRNIEKNTAKRYLHTKKYMKKSIQGPQPESGQVPTYYIFVTIIHKIHTISLNSCPCRTSESSFTASATNMLHSLFSDTLVLHTQNTSAICNY